MSTVIERQRQIPAILTGMVLMLVAWAAYILVNEHAPGWYNHFVWQADAFLHGRTAITFPVEAVAGAPGNAYFNDVLPLKDAAGNPTGFAQIPFPPLPAIILVPFVAVFGLGTDVHLISTLFGTLNVGLAYWMLQRLRVGREVRVMAAVFLGMGTVMWYASMIGTTWFFAHVVAIGFLLFSIGVALKHDGGRPGPLNRGTFDLRALVAEPRGLFDRRQFAAGLLFGLACTSRLTIVFGCGFFVVAGSGRSWLARAISAGLGAIIPVGALLIYNLATTGHLFHPAYEYLYQLEAAGYPHLGYNPAWAIEDLRYIPQNLRLMLFGGPDFGGGTCAEGSVRNWFDKDCPILLPRDVGMSLFLTSPAYLLAAGALPALRTDRRVAAALAAIIPIMLVNLAHFSQGWVQFGYRFSNDFAPFALILVAIGMAWFGWRSLLVWALLIASIVINWWGVQWGVLLGW